jgi:hypothetical protein
VGDGQFRLLRRLGQTRRPPHPCDACRPSKLCITCYPGTTNCFGALCWLSYKLHRCAFLDVPRGLKEKHSGAGRAVDRSPPVIKPELQSVVTGLQVPDEKPWTVGRGYESPVLPVRVLRWLHVAVGRVFTHRPKSTGETRTASATTARMTRVDLAVWKDVWNVRQLKYDDIVLSSWSGTFRTLSL